MPHSLVEHHGSPTLTRPAGVKVTKRNIIENIASEDIRDKNQRWVYRTYQHRKVPFSEGDRERRDESDQRKEDNSVQNALHCIAVLIESRAPGLDSVVWITDPM